MVDLKAGIKKFQQDIFPGKQSLYEDLKSGQNPSVLLITCSDSRIVPQLICQTEPGEVFVCRNAGNLVPEYGDSSDGTAASIEFALASCDISTIVICGHSDCRAMHAAMDTSLTETLPTLRAWLEENHQHSSHCCDLESTTLDNIQQQMARLETYPNVKSKLAKGQLKIVGWYYDIGTGEVREIEQKK